MKRLFSIVLILFICVTAGCDNAQKLRVAHLSDATSGLSTNYAVKMILDKDERMKEKYVDLQIKSSTEGQKLTIQEEREDEFDIFLENKDKWYNLTVLIAKANGLAGHETYQKYVDKGNKTYIITSLNDTKITLRVVAGNVVENDAGTGQILTSIDDVSDELELEIKKSDLK